MHAFHPRRGTFNADISGLESAISVNSYKGESSPSTLVPLAAAFPYLPPILECQPPGDSHAARVCSLLDVGIERPASVVLHERQVSGFVDSIKQMKPPVASPRLALASFTDSLCLPTFCAANSMLTQDLVYTLPAHTKTLRDLTRGQASLELCDDLLLVYQRNHRGSMITRRISGCSLSSLTAARQIQRLGR